MKKLYRFLFCLHIFVGIGAIFGGLASILNPQEPLGVTAESMPNFPFANFLIPGIILFTIIGLGSIISALAIIFKSKYHGYISCVFSFALMIWIIVQCIMISLLTFLHVLYFLFGLIGVVLSVIILLNLGLFPTNIFNNFNKNKRDPKIRLKKSIYKLLNNAF